MRKIFLIIIFVHISLHMYTQELTVMDKETSETLAWVTVFSENKGHHITTNYKGKADISVFVGEEVLEFRLLGYKTILLSYNQIAENSYVVKLEAYKFRLDEVVVSATRWKQSLSDVPAKIHTIRYSDIFLQNPQTAADLLGNTGEVFIQKSQQGGGSPMIRGFATNRLLYTVDGVRMNNAIFRSGNIQNVISLDPMAIESAEVLFGPGSIIYGSDAVGGVMAFRTLTPRFSENDKTYIAGKAFTRYSNANNEKTVHFDVNVAWRKFAMLTSISSSDFGHLKMGNNGPDEYLRNFYVLRIDSTDRIIENTNPLVQYPTAYSQINMMQKIRYQPVSNFDFQYAFHYSETSDFSRYDRLIELKPDGMPRSAVWNYGPQKWMMNYFRLDNKSENIFYEELSVTIAQQYFAESRIDRNYSGTNSLRLRTQEEEVWAYSANLDLVRSFGKNKIFYGAEAVINNVQSEASATNINTEETMNLASRYPESTWSSYAAFANYQYKFSNKNTLQAGLRYSHFIVNSDFSKNLAFFPFDFESAIINNNALTGSIGLVYSPNNTWRIATNVSTGFRAPNVDDIGKIFDFGIGEIMMPNPELQAEYAYNGEINIAKIFVERIKIDANAYYTYLDNAMLKRPYTINGLDSVVFDGNMAKIYALQNASYAYVYGWNLSVDVKLPHGFSFYSAYSFQYGIEETVDMEISRARHAAPAFGVTRLSFVTNKIKLQLYAAYATEISYKSLNYEERLKPYLYAIDKNGNPYSPAWYTLNFKAMYELTDNFTISAGLENITDKRYRTYSSGIASAGRNFVISLRASF